MAEELTVFVVPVTTLDDPELASASGLVSAALSELVPDNQYAQEYSAEDNHSRAAAIITNTSLIEARKFVRICIEQCNSWLANRLRKEPQNVKAMVLRWNEIFSTITAEARSRDTRKSNQGASNNAKQAAVSQT
jgi:hypothetical protein